MLYKHLNFAFCSGIPPAAITCRVRTLIPAYGASDVGIRVKGPVPLVHCAVLLHGVSVFGLSTRHGPSLTLSLEMTIDFTALRLIASAVITDYDPTSRHVWYCCIRFARLY